MQGNFVALRLFSCFCGFRLSHRCGHLWGRALVVTGWNQARADPIVWELLPRGFDLAWHSVSTEPSLTDVAKGHVLERLRCVELRKLGLLFQARLKIFLFVEYLTVAMSEDPGGSLMEALFVAQNLFYGGTLSKLRLNIARFVGEVQRYLRGRD